jgi:hypothetical protein
LSAQVLLQNGKDDLMNNVRSKNNFQFDWAFGSTSLQDRIYDEMCKPLIEKLYQGYNATFFACKLQNELSICFLISF